MAGDLTFIPNRVPVFPLPEVVLFPQSMVPLHVFEPRYREMTTDALAGSGFIATALLREGYEPYYYTLRAPIHPVIAVGQILASEETDDGDYNILLRGVERARILEEVPHKPYRVARIEPLATSETCDEAALAAVRADLRQAIAAEVIEEEDMRSYWLRLIDASLDLGTVADLIASALPTEAELRQCLLAEIDPLARTHLLLDQIRTWSTVMRTRRTQSPSADWNMN